MGASFWVHYAFALAVVALALLGLQRVVKLAAMRAGIATPARRTIAVIESVPFTPSSQLHVVRAGARRNLYLQLVLLPFWTSFLVRTYAWLFILRDTGLINTILHTHLQLLYNDGAVLLGLVYNFLPFFVLPMYATLEKLDPSLLEAAADLGAKPFATLSRVIIPISAPGIAAGAVLVFIPCLGAYLTPDLLGGGKTVMLGKLVQNQFTTARDWPFGSAASLLLMLASALLLAALMRSRAAKELM